MEATPQAQPLNYQSMNMSSVPQKDTSDVESIDHEQSTQETHPNLPLSIDKKKQLHEDQKSITYKRYLPLLILNYILLFVGSVASSLLSKYYFIHKGDSKWVSTWVQCAGFPVLVIPIFLPTILRYTKRKPFTDFNLKISVLSIFVGLMLGVNNFLISWGVAYLPVSTSALLLSSQLAFNLILSAIIVKQKITFSNLNCVILITLGSIILALNSSSERPQGLTQKYYFIGFFCTLGAGLLFALYLPVMEKIYKRVYCYEMVMEIQFIMEIAATALATIGMLWEGGFSEMKNEAENVFDKGPTIYWVTIVSTVITWQCCFMGTAGMVFLTSSLTGGICSTALLSMNVLGGVIVFKDAFGGFKAVSTILCLWGFSSYVYGMYIKMVQEKAQKKKSHESSTELIPTGNSGDTH
ncbi:hypothetical protein VNO77_23568 [Canavalia gladiata]|uniref:Probable purine permease n=1 Tax=Canavalia gladiata TaxID=3824 RepID=A0AAN9L5F9_CANGL